MKKNMLRLVVCLMSIFITAANIAQAADTTTHISGALHVSVRKVDETGEIYFIEAESENTLMFRKNPSHGNVFHDAESMLFALRATFEWLGADVVWEEETGNVLIKYQDKTWVCELDLSKDSGVIRVTNPDSVDSSDYYLPLNENVAEGSFYMINDRIYLGGDTGIYLLEHFGYYVRFIDYGKKTALALTSEPRLSDFSENPQ